MRTGTICVAFLDRESDFCQTEGQHQDLLVIWPVQETRISKNQKKEAKILQKLSVGDAGL